MPDAVVDIYCSVLNGQAFLPDFLKSIREQTHREWRLWLRDDGSSDATVALFEQAVTDDPRIRVMHIGGPRLGVAQSFGWMLERLPKDGGYMMPADADDVWLPRKIERTLETMQAAERESGASAPILVHTDLTVVETDLRERHPSFWRYTDLRPEPATLRRIAVRNPATGPTIMFNAALRARIGTTPPEATHHDWWYALVAAAVGRVVALHESTVLYRQHGSNDVGAQPKGPVPLTRLPATAARALRRTDHFRTWIGKSARQAGALLARYGDELNPDDRQFLLEYSRLAEHSSMRRKLELVRLGALPETGLLRRIGAVLRA